MAKYVGVIIIWVIGRMNNKDSRKYPLVKSKSLMLLLDAMAVAVQAVQFVQ